MAPAYARNRLLDSASLHPGGQTGTNTYIILDYLLE